MAHQPVEPPRVAAILDLDRTIIDVDAGFSLARHLVQVDRDEIARAAGRERRQLARRLRRRMVEVYAKAAYLVPLYRARVVRRSRLVRESYAFFRGFHVDELRAVLREFFESELKHRVYPGVKALLAWHHEKGHDTAVITSAPQSIATLFAAHLGIAHAVGVRLEHVDGRITGRVKEGPLWGRDKLRVAADLAGEHDWHLGHSYAYTDHDSDVALLEAVGHPIAVHPNARLRAIAKERGWPIIELGEAGRVRELLTASCARTH